MDSFGFGFVDGNHRFERDFLGLFYPERAESRRGEAQSSKRMRQWP